MSDKTKQKEYQKEYQAARYKESKGRGICVVCRQKLAVEGQVRCAECVAKQNEQKRERFKTDEDFRNQTREAQRKRRERLKEQGICVNCGKNPAEEGKTKCVACAAKRREAVRRSRKAAPEPRFTPREEIIEKVEHRQALNVTAQKRRELREKRIAEGLCVRCGHPAMVGYTTCAECRESHKKWDAKYYARKKEEEAAAAEVEEKPCAGIASIALNARSEWIGHLGYTVKGEIGERKYFYYTKEQATEAYQKELAAHDER